MAGWIFIKKVLHKEYTAEGISMEAIRWLSMSKPRQFERLTASASLTLIDNTSTSSGQVLLRVSGSLFIIKFSIHSIHNQFRWSYFQIFPFRTTNIQPLLGLEAFLHTFPRRCALSYSHFIPSGYERCCFGLKSER